MSPCHHAPAARNGAREAATSRHSSCYTSVECFQRVGGSSAAWEVARSGLASVKTVHRRCLMLQHGASASLALRDVPCAHYECLRHITCTAQPFKAAASCEPEALRPTVNLAVKLGFELPRHRKVHFTGSSRSQGPRTRFTLAPIPIVYRLHEF